MRPFWRRGAGGRAWTAIFQRAYDRFAEALVFKDSPGQPRYYDNNGIAVAELALLSGGSLAWNAGIQEDNTGPAFTDDTADLNDADANDVAPFPAGAGANDAFYFGSRSRFGQLTIVVGTAGLGTYTITWEYWDGDSWEDLSATDNTTSFKTGGSNTVTYTLPTNWAPTIIADGAGDFGPWFFVRARRDAGTVTTDPLLTSATADSVPIPDSSQGPTFEGAMHAGDVRIMWEGSGFTTDFEVYARLDDSVTVLVDGTVVFTGGYALIHSESGLAHLEEINVENAYRPIFIRPTAATGAGTLRIAPI